MNGLDTNVLVRYLTQDDKTQAARAGRYLAALVARGDRAFIGPVVLCELVWVLRDAYDTPKADVIRTMERILDTTQFEIGSKDLVRQALDAYRTGGGDFADYLIGAMATDAGCEETATFDRGLKGADGFRVL